MRSAAPYRPEGDLLEGVEGASHEVCQAIGEDLADAGFDGFG